MSWNNPLIPGCRIDAESKTITCDAKKILGDKVIAGSGKAVFGVENGRLYPLDEGEMPQEMIKQLMLHIQRTYKARKM